MTNCGTLNQLTKNCSVCNSGYYLKADGTCAVANLIPGCINYLTLNTCSLCESLLYLNLTKTMCLPNDPNLNRCANTMALG